MDFIYRLPMLDFDINDEQAVENYFPYILKAIHIASPDFYEKIKTLNFNQLNPKETLTL